MNIQIDTNAGEHMLHCNALFFEGQDPPISIHATLVTFYCSLAKATLFFGLVL
jgi:hypothetical protein